jgi:hypothetical protein
MADLPPTDRQLLRMIGEIVADHRQHKLQRIAKALNLAKIGGERGPYKVRKLTESPNYWRNYRKHRIALGVCVYCGCKNTSRPGKAGCRPCLDLRKAAYAPNLSRHSDQ